MIRSFQWDVKKLRGCSQQPIAHPVGTTVRVTDFLKHLPVRRQTALKSVPKILAKIRSLLQAYALARPAVRFSLKVLKAKNEKLNWLYAPSSGAGGGKVVDAALKVVGQVAVAQCEWVSWSSDAGLRQDGLDEQQVGGGDGYLL